MDMRLFDGALLFLVRFAPLTTPYGLYLLFIFN